MTEKVRLKVWAVSDYEAHGNDIDTRTSWVSERYKLYKNKEDAYRHLYQTVLRRYIKMTTADRIRTVGRPVVKYASGEYRTTGFMQFSIITRYDEYIYEAIVEKVF